MNALTEIPDEKPEAADEGLQECGEIAHNLMNCARRKPKPNASARLIVR